VRVPPRWLAWLDQPGVKAELLAGAWEIFSAMLFVSAVVPAAFSRAEVELGFLGTLVVSAIVARPLARLGTRGYAGAGAIRAVSWPLSVAPLVGVEGPQVFVAALAFGLMAGGMRRAIYRRVLEPRLTVLSAGELRSTLRARLGETATTAGIVGGHVMLLFSVAFLRTQSRILFHLWFELVPALALFGTVAFTLAVVPATRRTLLALDVCATSGPYREAAASAREAIAPDAPPESTRSETDALLRRGAVEAERLPDVLATLNFSVWFACAAFGVFWVRPGPAAWRAGDAVMQIGFAALFSLGVAYYQRLWNRDIARPVLLHIRRRLRGSPAEAEVHAPEPRTLAQRMLRDFGLPLVFMSALSLLASIGLYRTLGSELSLREDFNAVSALFASFTILTLALGAVVARAANDLSRPMAELARAADRIASGKLDAVVPRVAAPVEVVGLGESIDRMRDGLVHTIAELERERAGLEEKVDARTAELQKALDDLKRAQAALVQGERLASIGELVSGVAHEINNPLNAVAGAAVPLEELVRDVRRVLDRYRELEPELGPARRAELAKLRHELDLDASLDDLVGISTVIRRAVDRSVRIVTNLRNFSRTSGEAVPIDLHAALEETLMLLAPRVRQASITVDKRFGALPPVVCRGGEVNQVFMNLLVNAVQALGEDAPAGARGGDAEIVVETWVEGDFACVAVADTGPGVPPELAARVFDPFFTTKPRGQGTGLGLSISSDILRRHGGSLTLEATPRGARFVCRLLVAGPRALARASRPSGDDLRR
jgi:signal transduction histidine kinase